jgi:DNA-binding PadR family transcriptional regulator
LEGEGSLRSSWASPGPGPARRVHELTEPGRTTLDGWATSIESELQAMSGLLAAYYRAATEHHFSEADR